MRPSAFANMDNGENFFYPEDSMVMSGIPASGLESYSRPGGHGYRPSQSIGYVGRTSAGTGVRSRGEEMELDEVRKWQREETVKKVVEEDDERSTRSRPRSANDLTGRVKVQITTSVKWEDDTDTAGWSPSQGSWRR